MKIPLSRIPLFLLFLFLTLALVQQGRACVGKTLVIGATGNVQQELLAEMLSLLISERTGTTVRIERFLDSQQVHQAHLQAEVDIAIGYTGIGLVEVLGNEPLSNPGAIFQTVKARYNEEMNLIWLEPFGFEEPSRVSLAAPDQVAPVVRKDTLKKFPALARLINKLGGAIDNSTIATLEEESRQKALRDVARGFLRENRLI